MPQAADAVRRRSLASRADRHVLYQRAVQEVSAEIDFVDQTFRRLRKRTAARLREDFCGTAATACEWARRRPTNVAVGFDIDADTLAWGLRHNVAKLKPSVRERVTLLRRDVRRPGPEGGAMDLVLAMNFSWWLFADRPTLLAYFRSVRRSLADGGVFFLDIYGGWEASRQQRDRRQVGGKARGFTYIWDQAAFDPITNIMDAHIHFRMADGSRVRRAFSYSWRLWTIRECRDVLADAGFARSRVYWEGDDGRGGGDGDFKPAEHAEQCPTFIAYIAAEK